MTDPESGETVEATFAFVDLARFTAMTEAHGDVPAVAMIRAFRERALGVLGPDDEFVKSIGDAVMLRFASPERAVVALHRLLQGELTLQDTVLLPRAGAHHGPAVAIDGDYYGAAVNLAARVAGQAHGGQLLVTERTAVAARESGATITHVGCLELRNVADGVDIFDVRITNEPHSTVIDPVCQMRVCLVGTAALRDGARILDTGSREETCDLTSGQPRLRVPKDIADRPERLISKSGDRGQVLAPSVS